MDGEDMAFRAWWKNAEQCLTLKKLKRIAQKRGDGADTKTIFHTLAEVVRKGQLFLVISLPS